MRPPAAGPDVLLPGALPADRHLVTESTASGPRDGDVTPDLR